MALAGKSSNVLRQNPLLVAAIVSLVIHLAIFGGWKLNQRYHWLKNDSLPVWLQKMTEKIAPKNLVSSQIREAPLIFVDVDPQSSVKESPKDAKFYGAANSKAASAKKLDSELPEIKGKQDKIIKTTENSTSKAQPLQPSPAPPAENDTQESKPKQQEVVSDLALAKPQDQNKKIEGESDAEKKARSRPRRVEDVKPGLRGEKMSQQGGANRLEPDPSFNVKVTSFGDYDREFIAAVQQCWYELLEGRNTVPGKIIVEFRLNYDGRITDLKVAENTTHNPMLELICKSAIDKPSPYRKWPKEMRQELKTDTRDVRFTFYYE